jgi:Arc/MetJ-type ribon-helix-helix transcriptional regulator
MTVTLTPEQMRWLEEAVAKGQFSSVEDAVRVAVADLKTSLDQDDLDWVKPHLDEAEAQIERGEGIEGDEFLRWLDGRIAELKHR